MKSLRISGLYNKETLESLFLQNVTRLGFDQRPLSLNFIQGHVIESCLKEDRAQNSYYLQFCNEKEFVINALVEKLEELVTRENAFILEFSDEMPLHYYESFRRPFLWHLKTTSDYKKILESKWLETISLDNELLNELEKNHELYPFLNEIFKMCHENGKKIELNLNWNSDVSSSLIDFYQFDTIHFAINPLVESSYRHVDFSLLSSSLIHTKSILEI